VVFLYAKFCSKHKLLKSSIRLASAKIPLSSEQMWNVDFYELEARIGISKFIIMQINYKFEIAQVYTILTLSFGVKFMTCCIVTDCVVKEMKSLDNTSLSTDFYVVTFLKIFMLSL
jgi:hypothetical protein